MIRTFDVSHDGEEKPRVSYGSGTRQIVEGEYCSAEDALAIEAELNSLKADMRLVYEKFGNPDFPFTDGRTIFDLIQDGVDAIQLLHRYRDGHKVGVQECYLDIERGDFRCPECIEADRLTGLTRMLDSYREERIRHMRESLAQPNNGFA